MISKLTIIFVLFFCLNSFSQTFNGIVLEASTNQPLEGVSVYFDNTTIGTITNEKGEFSINFNDAVQSTLVISFLGYQKSFISDYRSKEKVVVKLVEEVNELETVVINADDGMSRALKMQKFKREFLGRSENGKSCKILNEDYIRLRYNKKTKTLTAWSKAPIIILNKNLKYKISFDLINFEASIGNWSGNSVIYTGTSFYEDLNSKDKKRIIKARNKTYKGSVQHFMRAMYNNNLQEEGYVFGKKGFVIKNFDVYTISEANKQGLKTVKFKENKIDIFYNVTAESILRVDVESFNIDVYGNYNPIPNVLFGGALGKQRVGDALPLDYGL